MAAPGTSDSLALGANSLNLLSGGTKPTLQLTALAGFGPGGSYTLATFDAGASLQLNGAAVADGAEPGRFVQGGGATGAIAIDASGLGLNPGNELVLNRQGNTLAMGFAPVPEPAALLLAAAIGLAAWRRR